MAADDDGSAAVSRETAAPEAPAEATELFGESLPLAVRYAGLLATEGTVRGLIGPREVPRIWVRHVLNSAVLGEAIPEGLAVCDLGSGAGLPGIPLAILRPDLRVTLLEPLLRRTSFLEEAIAQLGLGNVTVLRGRAEELARTRQPSRRARRTDAPDAAAFDVVTSRAVAPLDRLARWSLPLVRPGGTMLAIKGSSAPDELASALPDLLGLGAEQPEVLQLGSRWLDPPATVVRARRGVAE